MARWLCRLTVEEIRLGRDHFSLADSLGVEGWVLCGFSLSELSEGPAPWLSLLPAGARFVLELDADGIDLAEGGSLETALQPWLSHQQALRWQGQPLLLGHGSCPPSGLPDVQMVQVRSPGQAPDPRWSGVAESIPQAPTDYRRFLQIAHGWQGTGGATFIPAVRALTEPEVASWRFASAEGYREWLALSDATSDLLQTDAEGLVLLESWQGHRRWFIPNENDRTAAAAAVVPRSLPPRQRCWGATQPDHWALLVHGFYLDRLKEMLDPLLPVQAGGEGSAPLDLYVSTPLGQLPQAAALLQRWGWQRVQLFGVDNRGRDVAPFLHHLLPAAVASGQQFFVKVHTKRSPHLLDGDRWGTHLIESLLTPAALQTIQQILGQDASIGLLAPAGTLCPLAVHLDRNRDVVSEFQARYNLQGSWILSQHFIAGSMMAGRLDAIAPWSTMTPNVDAFEPEMGQTDGTLAHGLERTLCLDARRRNWSFNELPGDARAVPVFGYRQLEDK
jgi:hypothetical protein